MSKRSPNDVAWYIRWMKELKRPYKIFTYDCKSNGELHWRELVVVSTMGEFCVYAQYYSRQTNGSYRDQQGRKGSLTVYKSGKGSFINFHGKRYYL